MAPTEKKTTETCHEQHVLRHCTRVGNFRIFFKIPNPPISFLLVLYTYLSLPPSASSNSSSSSSSYSFCRSAVSHAIVSTHIDTTLSEAEAPHTLPYPSPLTPTHTPEAARARVAARAQCCAPSREIQRQGNQEESGWRSSTRTHKTHRR